MSTRYPDRKPAPCFEAEVQNPVNMFSKIEAEQKPGAGA
jgi:hypothetical protein